MRQSFFVIIAMFLFAGLVPTSVMAQRFGTFAEEPINAPGSYALIRDPTGGAPTQRVHRFLVQPGDCSAARYDNGLSDCDFQSVRAQLYETRQSQPDEAWYSWWMYLPSDFPLRGNQRSGGNYSFAYWHNRECPNLDFEIPEGETTLYLRTNRFGGPGNCRFASRIPLANYADLLGHWIFFEAHVKWSIGADGFAEIFMNQGLRTRYDGPTITAGTPDKNYFKFGVYLSSGRNTQQVTPAEALFTTPVRTNRRP